MRLKAAIALTAVLALVPAAASAQTPIRSGETVHGLIGAGNPAPCYLLETTPGSRWEINLQSASRDALLRVGRGESCETVAQWDVTNDDINTLFGNLNSRIRFVAGGGVYLIKPGFLGGGAGDFTLSVAPSESGGRTLAVGLSLEEVAPEVVMARIPPPEGSASTATGPLSGAASAIGQSFRDCDTCPEMVVIPSGNFMMGSLASEEGREADEGPRHPVAIGRPFALGRTEVTFDEYEACVAESGCPAPAGDQGWGRGRRPVIMVSHSDAVRYVAWLSAKTGQEYFLPTEAEWEYAARAGTTTPWNTGLAIITDDANFLNVFARTVPTGSYPPNAFGLHDMHGNVWEWTQDCMDAGYLGVPSDGSAATSGDCNGRRIVRGGGYEHMPNQIRSAERAATPSATRNADLGFRVARAL